MKKVIVSRQTGKVYRDLQEAADGMGVSVSTVSRQLADGTGNVRFVDRVFLVKVEKEGWLATVMDCRNTGYVVIGSVPERKIRRSEARDVKDVTVEWHAI